MNYENRNKEKTTQHDNMLRCFSLKATATIKPSHSSLPSSSSPPRLQSTNDNPNSTSREHTSPTSTPDQDPSPPLSFTREYALIVQARSYTEIRDRVIVHHASPPLRPSRGSVDEALGRATPSNLTRLVSSYFDHSESTSHILCSLLHHSLHQAKSLYAPLHSLLDVLPLDHHLITQLQCDDIYNIFLGFNSSEQNPFPRPNSDTFGDMRRCFTQLKHQLDRRLRRAQSRSRFPHSAICILSELIRNPARVTLPSKFVKKQRRHIAQIDAAAVGAYVANYELETINCLVERLHDVVESDRFLVRFGVERGRDRHPIQEAVNQLRKNRPNLEKQMEDLEEHVCICLASVNTARLRLLEEIRR